MSLIVCVVLFNWVLNLILMFFVFYEDVRFGLEETSSNAKNVSLG